jgi:hypothetical protein
MKGLDRSDGGPNTLTLSDGANRFLHALRDLGFMDGRLEAEVLDRAMAEFSGTAGFEDIRRLVAEVAFDQRASGAAGGWLDFMDEEWKLIFH